MTHDPIRHPPSSLPLNVHDGSAIDQCRRASPPGVHPFLHRIEAVMPAGSSSTLSLKICNYPLTSIQKHVPGSTFIRGWTFHATHFLFLGIAVETFLALLTRRRLQCVVFHSLVNRKPQSLISRRT
jgi:hypothetical protein